MRIDIDMHALISELPPARQQEAVQALQSCDVEEVYRFLRSALSSSHKMMLDMAWRLVGSEQKLFLNQMLRKGLEQDNLIEAEVVNASVPANR